MRGKIGRNYRLDITTPAGKQITIEPPFSLYLDITRNTLASANRGTFTIYNLGPATRNQIYKDRFSITEYWQVRLWAGYGNRLHEVFTGNMYEGYSDKQGKDWITVLDCFDGMNAIQNGFMSETIQAGTPNGNIFSRIIDNMPNVVAGLFGTLEKGEAPRGKALIGQASDILSTETGGNYFIDKETVNILTDEEVLPGEVVLLDSDQLLTTPKRREAFIDVKTLFEPQVQIGQVYEIDSLQARYNGQYKIVGFHHVGMISESVGGTLTTDLSLYFGAEGLQEVSG